MKVHYISMSCYPIFIGITDSPEAYQREMKRIGIINPNKFTKDGGWAETHFFHDDKGIDTAIICVDLKKLKKLKCSSAQVVSIIVHEAVHCWQECELIMGEKTPGREIEAYAIQWISQCCIEAILK